MECYGASLSCLQISHSSSVSTSSRYCAVIKRSRKRIKASLYVHLNGEHEYGLDLDVLRSEACTSCYLLQETKKKASK